LYHAPPAWTFGVPAGLAALWVSENLSLLSFLMTIAERDARLGGVPSVGRIGPYL
jgi:hypothetical protein